MTDVLVVTPYFYPEGGGLENYAYNISKRLVKKGYHIKVLCSTYKNSKEETIDGIRIIRQRPDFILSNTPVKLDLFFKISRLIKENDFDLINAHTPVPYYADVAAIAGKMYGIPFVLTYHNDLVKESFLNILAQAYNYSVNPLTLALSTKIITPSAYCFNESSHLMKVKKKIVWIPPAADTNIFFPGDSKEIFEWHNVPEKSKIVLFVGSLGSSHAHKGVDYLIKAMGMVSKKIPDSYLIVVGEGDMKEHYGKLSSSAGIQDRVIFTGHVSTGRISPYYRGCDVLVLPSITIAEGTGMTLLEANACGKPVIGTKIGGIKYVIKNGETGLLVPPEDSAALAKAIIKILKNRKLADKMGAKGRKLVEEKYSWEKVSKMTEEVYESVYSSGFL